MPGPLQRGVQRGAPLPYSILAGVESCAEGWLVATGNLQGITLAPQPPQVFASLADVLDYRPAFSVIALHAPVGLPEEPGQPRACDVAAREVLGNRRAAVVPPPAHAVLGAAGSYEEAKAIDPSMGAATWRLLPRIAEVATEVGSYRQRVLWEVNPELAFWQMNDGRPLRFRKRSQHGRQERTQLLVAKLPGAERLLNNRPRGVRVDRLLDAAADLWMARRIVARAVTRLADPPEWDAEGVRMDLVC
jgi:predicted RNase H-like nuclease